MQKNNTKKILTIINIVVVISLLSLLIFLTITNWDYIMKLSTAEGQLEFKERISNTGIIGVIILIVIQVLQIVVAFIPGEFVEVIAGMLFGPIFGMIVCMIGLFIGSLAIFGLVKLLGKPFFDLNVNDKNKSKLKFLEDETRALIILFFVFLIPGTPKDFITYAIPFTKIKFFPFIIVTTIARIPSIITSTIIGSSILTGDTNIAIIVSIITAILAIIGIIFNKQITNKVEEIVQNRKSKEV